MIKRRAKKSLHNKTVKAKAKAGLVAKSKARQRKRVHRVARGKPKPGHIVGHSRRRRKGEILCHNHVLHTAATANGVHGFHWFTVSAPTGWDPASEAWEVCPCGWRPGTTTSQSRGPQVVFRNPDAAAHRRDYAATREAAMAAFAKSWRRE